MEIEGERERNSRMIMRQTYQINPGQMMQVDRRVRLPSRRNPGPEMDVIACVEEILQEGINNNK